MVWDWDEKKRRGNLDKHGIDFADCPRVFDGPTMLMEDDRLAYGERRYLTLGLLGRHVVAITHTATPDRIRLISARKATRREHDLFFSQIAH